jgi:hypothetical protein
LDFFAVIFVAGMIEHYVDGTIFERGCGQEWARMYPKILTTAAHKQQYTILNPALQDMHESALSAKPRGVDVLTGL